MNKSLDDLIIEFLEYLEIEKNCSRLTIRDYKHYLNRFSSWYSPLSKTISDLSLDEVRKFRLYLAHLNEENGNSLARVTQNYYIIALRSFLRWLIKHDYKTLSPEKIDLPKTESRSLKFLNSEQIVRLLNQPGISTSIGLRDKAILETLFSTGLRVSELVSLDRDAINLERKEFGVMGKGRKTRVVFLSDGAVSWIQRYLAVREDEWKPLFIRYSGKKDELSDGREMRLTVRSVQRILEKYVKKARLPIKATPHTMRHSFATDLLIAGADIRSVQEMLGHKNISTTQIYTHVTNKQLREVHETFHGKGK